MLFGSERKLKHHIYRIMFSPMDSVRYFEFDFVFESITRNEPTGRYLDVSSPRLLPAILLMKFRRLLGEIVNPDMKDLQQTRELMERLGVGDRCSYRCCVADGLQLSPESFETITSISVIEHIPGKADSHAIGKLWGLLKRGGRLLLSVPCACEAFEEYIDFNEYGLLQPDDDAFVFGQRFYDEELLQERIFHITGKPIRWSIYGERECGSFLRNREKKLADAHYPFWKEPYVIGKEYSRFDSINELPGWGVIAMEFIKG